MKTKFEKVMAENITEYKKILSQRLNELLEEDPNALTVDLYWDYRDEISLDDLYEIEKRCKTKDEMLFELEQVLFDLNDEYIFNTQKELVEELINSCEVSFENPDDEIEFFESDEFRDLSEILLDNYGFINLNVEELLEKTPMFLNVIPYQDENSNREGSELSQSLESLIKAYLNPEFKGYWNLPDKEDELIVEIEESPVIVELFKSQGYEYRDLADEEKVSKSKFLGSLIEEIENDPLYGSSFVTFLIKTNALDYINNFVDVKGKTLRILPDNNAVCGIFNPVVGAGSLLELKLEKPFDINLEHAMWQVEDRKRNYGYPVGSIYGFCNDAWDGKYEIIKEETK